MQNDLVSATMNGNDIEVMKLLDEKYTPNINFVVSHLCRITMCDIP